MKSYFYLACILLVGACSPPSAGEFDLEPNLGRSLPNIVWLVAEDMSPYIPAFGDSTIQTPHLSRLASEGVRYTHFFSPSGVCAPSRAALATGMYPSGIGANHMRTGPWVFPGITEEMVQMMARFMPEGIVPYETVPGPEVKMLSQYLREAGYYCSNLNKDDHQFRASLVAWDNTAGFQSGVSASSQWQSRPAGAPFFSYINFMVTHESQIWTKAKDSLWVDDDLEVPVPPYLPNTAVGKADIRRMYSNIKEMDFQVGQVLQDLEADGLLENTLVIWFTDHGGPLPRQKRLCYDSGLRVPMIIRFPGKQHAGKTDSRLVSFVDMLPTMLSLAGIEPPAYLDGQAFLGQYRSGQDRTYIHGASDRFDAKYDMIRAVRDKQFKYLKNFQPEKPYYLPVAYREQMPIMQELLRMRDAGELNHSQSLWFREKKAPEELFDLENDPHELNNLAHDPKYRAKLEALRKECERWMAEIDDKGLMDEQELLKSMWPDKVQPATEAPTASRVGERLGLSCTTPGASIGYQLMGEGDSLGNVWNVYIEPIPLPTGKKLIAKAHRLGYTVSEALVIE